MKKLLILLIYCFILVTDSYGASISSSHENSNKETQFGISLSAAKEFKIMESIITEDNKDYLYNQIGVFANYYGDILDYSYGADFSFGYGYDRFGVYARGGYLISDFDYRANNISQSNTDGSVFLGLGASYIITDNLKAKLDFINYSLDFKPNNSSQTQKTELDINSFTIGLQFYF